MNLSMTTSELKQYVASQLAAFFPDKHRFEGNDVDAAFDTALERLEYCFKHVSIRYYNNEKGALFSHLHGDQYSSFLYFLANSLWLKAQNTPLCDKLLCLNKALNAVFISYKCKMPDIFLLTHAVGSVIGNAVYDDFLVIHQHVTINSAGDVKGSWPAPVIGRGVWFSAGAKIIGGGKVGHCTTIGAGANVFAPDVPDHSVVFIDRDGKLNIKVNKHHCLAQECFNVDIMAYKK